tara:strand:- start:147 stop:398 length:252 start_codon:yes stop_codon:yes gene_type:complete
MSLITHIDNVPLFTTIAEAETWGDQYGLTGYHEHTVLGQTGYMGGVTHSQIVAAMVGGTVQTRLNASQSTSSSGGSSGGGGGY